MQVEEVIWVRSGKMSEVNSIVSTRWREHEKEGGGCFFCSGTVQISYQDAAFILIELNIRQKYWFEGEGGISSKAFSFQSVIQ